MMPGLRRADTRVDADEQDADTGLDAIAERREWIGQEHD